MQIRGTEAAPRPPGSVDLFIFFLLRIPGKSFSLPYAAATDTEVPGFDTDICTSKAAGEAARKQHQWKTTSFLFFSPPTHTCSDPRHPEERGGEKKKEGAAAVFSTGLHGSIPLSLSKPRA